MRDIKFRGVTPTGCWVKGSLIYHGEQPQIQYVKRRHPDDGRVLETDWAYVDPKTVGQFVIQTPKDLNKFNKEGNYDGFYDLYEDDIVQARESFVYYNSVYPFPCKKGDKFVLSHYDAGFCLVPINKFENWAKDGRSPIMGGIIDNYELWNLHSKFVPIGNIHDNTEMLTAKTM